MYAGTEKAPFQLTYESGWFNQRDKAEGDARVLRALSAFDARPTSPLGRTDSRLLTPDS